MFSFHYCTKSVYLLLFLFHHTTECIQILIGSVSSENVAFFFFSLKLFDKALAICS